MHESSAPTITNRFREVAARFAERVAIRHGGTMTYRELDLRSDQVAGHLANIQVANIPVIGISLANISEAITAMIGVMKTGHAYIFIRPDSPVHWKLAIAKEMPLEAVIGDTTAGAWPGFTGRWIDLSAAMRGGGRFNDSPHISPADTACLVQTSGSTGEPLGVEISHAALLHTIGGYTSVAAIAPDDRLTMLTSPVHFAAHTAIFGALLNGACLCPFDVKALGFVAMAEWLQREKLTIFQSPPSLFRAFASQLPPSRRFAAVRFLRLGGEPALANDFILSRKHFPQAQFANALGMSEAGGNIALFCPAPDFVFSSPDIPVGSPCTGQDVFIADSLGTRAAPGESGEIVVRSEFLATGYYRRPELTQQRFKTSNDGHRELWTGDLGHFTSEGWLVHEGRRDDQVKIRGHRVSLTGLESQLRSIPEVREARVLARRECGAGDDLLAFVMARDKTMTAEAVHRRLTDLHAGPVQPRIILVEEFPLNGAGKIDRQSLLQLASVRHPWRTSAGPRNKMEHELVSIWKTELGIESIGVYDDFFAVGGDSLKAIKVSASMESRYRIPFPPHLFLDRRTVAQLAEYIAMQPSLAAPPFWQCLLPTARAERVVSLRDRPHGQAAPLFVCPGGWGHERELLAFADLLHHLPPAIPVYGLKQNFLSPCVEVTNSVPAMAKNFIAQIKKIQPTGPYRLLGECIGSIIILEIAQQLETAGDPLENIFLLDPRLPTSTPETGSENAATTKKVQLYYRLLTEAILMPCAQAVSIIVGKEAAEDARARCISWGVFDSAQLDIICVPGNHHTYLREHGAEVAREIAALLSKNNSGRTSLDTRAVAASTII